MAVTVRTEAVLPRIDAEDMSDLTVQERILWCRVTRGLSQRDLGEGAGMTGAYVSRIEMGERDPSLEAIREFARVLAVHPVWLETGHVARTTQQRRGKRLYAVTYECLG